jgi:tetratricopeptide (TPR) repeat protein
MTPMPDTADNFYKEGNYRAALRIYLDIVQQESRNAKLYQGLAQCYYQLKNYESAKSAAEKALELDSRLSIPHTVLAYIYYYQNNNLKKALTESLEAYDLSPNMEETINCHGSLLAASGRLAEGKAVLMQGLEIYPRSIPLHYNMAAAYNKERNYKKSSEEIKTVFKYKPTLRHGIQLLIVYEQRYALLITLIVLTALFGSLFVQAKILLLIPLVIAIQGWILTYNVVKESNWKDALVYIVGNGLLTVLIYWFYTSIN